MGICDFYLFDNKAVNFMFLLHSFSSHIRISGPETGSPGQAF